MSPGTQNRETPDRPPNCVKCAYFRVTWDPAFPRSCAVFGIMSLNLPSAEVFRATGRHCPSFIPREAAKEQRQDRV
ncbi:MAG: hypothetical protein LBI86_12275 [Treponema sp.]|nr:hypothetical protein [Treponema sp.]